MLTIKKILTKFNIQYEDNLEEEEFIRIKTPIVREFLKYLFLIFSVVLTLYTIRYFIKEAYIQSYILVGLIIFSIFIFLVQTHIRKHLEKVLLLYIIALVCVFASVFNYALKSDMSRTTFYIGYIFAMIHRLIGYRVLNVKYVFVLYVVSLCLKFPLIVNPEGILTAIAVILDIATVALSYKSERDERTLFDALYKSKQDILKFKHLLTQYLPNQMAIFASDYSVSHYTNNSFKRTFKVKETTHVREALDKLLVEKETVEKNKTLFRNLGYSFEDASHTLTLSGFMKMMAQNVELLRDLGVVSIPVIESEVNKDESVQVVEGHAKAALQAKTNELKEDKAQNTEPASRGASQDNKKENPYGLVENNNETVKSSEKGSKSVSSDMAYEEGRRRVFKVKIFPLMWDETEAMAMVFDDITQQRIITELKVADKNKDLVIAMVSHELRTPLNGMLGLIDIAKKNISEPNTQFYLSACRDSGMLLLNLVNSILDMNQLKNKKLRLVHAPINVQELLGEIKMLFNQTCKIKSLFFNVKISPDIPKVVNSDKSRLSQILINLLGNAFKFTFKGGVTIKVDMETTSPCRVRFSVEDTGIGIKKEDQDKLFQMYGKLEQQDRKINTNGVGLGLTISNSLAMLLDPTGSQKIQVKSEPDQGTCFSFVIESMNLGALKKSETSAGDISSLALVEDKDTTVFKNVTVYQSANYENFSRVNFTQNFDNRSWNLDAKRSGSPVSDKRLIEHKSTGNRPMLVLPSFSMGQKIYSGPTLKPGNHSPSPSEVNHTILRIPESSPKDLFYEEIGDNKSNFEKPWCLVVDDNPFNLMVACHIMEERQYQVKTALNGKEAITRAAEHQKAGHQFKVVLMDCQMPVMDGYEATRILRKMMKNEELTECPIVALTANNRDDEHEKLCNDVGMSGHVAKPLQITELEAVLKSVHPKNLK